jgi:hypothetical protein
MEMANLIDVLLGLVVVGAGWWINNMSTELKRLRNSY